MIDDNQMEYFFDRPELFYDNMHLNGDGARIFTDMFINQILKSDFYKKIKSKKNETELGVLNGEINVVFDFELGCMFGRKRR